MEAFPAQSHGKHERLLNLVNSYEIVQRHINTICDGLGAGLGVVQYCFFLVHASFCSFHNVQNSNPVKQLQIPLR